MGAGQQTELIELQAATATTDDHNEETQDWSYFAKEWAEVFWGRGSERRQAASEQNQQAATFRVNANSKTRAIDIASHRIVMRDGSEWDIQGVVPDKPARGKIEIDAVRSA